MYLGVVHFQFVVLPRDKNKSYIGDLGGDIRYIPMASKALISKDGSTVWLHGGGWFGQRHQSRNIELRLLFICTNSPVCSVKVL